MRRIEEEEASLRCDQLFSPLPLEGPSNPTVTAVSRTEVIVSWDPPGQFLLTRLKCYEVYINASTKPTYAGTQTFCHLRGLKPDCQYHFKVQMVLKSEAVPDKTTLNSKGGASRHYSENLQPPSSMHRRRRQAHDRHHVNGKIHPQTDKRNLLGLTASGHSIHKEGGIVGTAELQSCISHALKRSNRNMVFYPFLLNNRIKGFSFRIPN
ncbi:usherin [Echinococcus multilocularis]|uniref:Usherin n=1 Tax=Echinococcus multilocularis TaxID=6211 RepID=A0A087VZ94_ECHMU|nr:usherin [Echinococcus multilocularis]